MELLKELTALRGASGDESRIKEFVINYVKQQQENWKSKPTIIEGDLFQDCVLLIFGQPKTAIYAHMDSIGFTVGYDKELIKIGGPRIIEGTALVGSDSKGEIETELMVIEHETGEREIQYVSDRIIDRGTNLTFQPNFRETDVFVQSPYLDNRLGMWNALKVAETLEHGALVFTTYEEHGGNSVSFCAKYLLDNFGVRQALISDITWVTHGVIHGGGVAISMRDSWIPRKVYLNRIIELAQQSGVSFQLEVESAGGSDGTALQKSHLPIDWCFIGAPEDNVHTPDEIVNKLDIIAMVELYRFLMVHL
jgi:putative aminopeptidase FrvX